MRLIAFTDLHENERLLQRIKVAIKDQQIDLAVCAGDFTVFGNQTKRMMGLLDNLGVPVVLIPGNHEDEEEVASLLPQHKNILWAHERFIEVQGLRFFGFGGRGFSRREPDLEFLEEKYKDQFNEKTVVISHAPPYGTGVDEVEPDWHVGNESLTQLIKRRKPMLVLCGHIHECFHVHDSVAGTTIINPGNDAEIIEVED